MMYLHFAYAMSADGSSGFSKTSFEGAKYLGICYNHDEDDVNLVYSDYTWNLLKGR